MTAITFIDHHGQSRTLDAEPGLSVMHIALAHGVDGIVAECGGNLSCATCHVQLDPAWAERVPPAGEFEQAALEGVLDPGPHSRLCCQITLTPELAGLVLHLPARQL